MENEWNDDEAIHITGDSADELLFFQKIMDDPSIMERIPKGATIRIVETLWGEHDRTQHLATAQAIDSFEVGDQTIYILAVPAKDHAAD